MRVKKHFKVVAGMVLVLLSIGSVAVSAAELNGLEIMQKGERQRKVADERVRVKMELINGGGNVRSRTAELATQTLKSGLQNSLIRFLEPKSVAGAGLLTVEHMEAADDQWLYLPALKRSRRISPAGQTDSFMGTDFTFEDLRPEDMEAFNYTVKGQEKVDGMVCHVIEVLPKNEDKKNESGYKRRIIWVRTSDDVVIKIDFYDKQNGLQKTFLAFEVRTVGTGGISRAHQVVMQNHKTGHKTRLKYSEFKINAGVDMDIFSARALERSW